MNVYMVVKSTSYIFLTAMAPNALALSLMAPILGFKMDWLQWFLATSIPGLLCLFLIPLVCYFTAPPELKQVDNKAIADKGLAELGPITFGAGYNDIKSWWIAGAIVAFGSLIIHCTIGVAWWNFLLNLGWL